VSSTTTSTPSHGTPLGADLPAAAGAPGIAPPRHGEKPADSLVKKAIRGGLWTGGGVVATQMMAFASNILLSWVLLREHFGVMVLINTIITGLRMFSDVGITPCLIQNPRQDAAFYNTAWTIQVVRGFVLWLAACLLAWPLSQVQHDWAPLSLMLPVAALTTVIDGFRSTAYITANRRLQIAKIAAVEFGTAVVRTLVMLFAVYLPDVLVWLRENHAASWDLIAGPLNLPSSGLPLPVLQTAWSLVAGLLAGAVFMTLASHFMIREVRNRLHFEKKAFGELIRYGKWLFLSTVITFFAATTDRWIIGGILSVSMLGLYGVAMRFAELGPLLFRMVGQWVGFPALSEVYRRDPENLGKRLLHLRIAVCVPICLLLLSMILLGPLVTYVCYRGSRDNLVEAGWIIQVLSVMSLAGTVSSSYGNVYLAIGRTFYNMLTVGGQFVCMTGSALLGYWLYGESGLILGLGASQWLKYIVDAVLIDRCGYYQPKFDLLVLTLSAVGALLALWGSELIVRTWVL